MYQLQVAQFYPFNQPIYQYFEVQLLFKQNQPGE